MNRLRDAMTESSAAIFETDGIRADLFLADPPRSARQVVITFTERGHSDLAGPGFASPFLLGQRRDVIAVKNVRDDWYAAMTSGELDALKSVAAPYPARATYGSSMGAFAAIRFAARLDVQTVIAISPVLDLRPDWDTRFRVDLPIMERFGHCPDDPMFRPEHVRSDIDYCVAYDPRHLQDKRHLEALREIAPRLHAVAVPFGGHPVGPALRDAGCLGTFVTEALDTGRITNPPPIPVVKTPWVRHAQVRYLLEREKLRSALVVSRAALAQSPEWSEAQLVHAQILERLGRVDEAIPHALKAIEREPQSPYFVAIVAQFLKARDRHDLAIELLDAGIERIGALDVLVNARREVFAN